MTKSRNKFSLGTLQTGKIGLALAACVGTMFVATLSTTAQQATAPPLQNPTIQAPPFQAPAIQAPAIQNRAIQNPRMQTGPTETLPNAQRTRIQYQPLTTRIKDIAQIGGAESYRVSGLGVVIALPQTGSDDDLTKQYVQQYLANHPTGIPAEFRENFLTRLKGKGFALVRVTAKIPAFAAQGQDIDASVAIFGNATSLRDGELLETPLRGADGKLYGFAQGKIMVGGIGKEADAASFQQNTLTHGTVIKGCKLTHVHSQDNLGIDGFIDFHLINGDRSTAVNVAEAINRRFPRKAQIVNRTTIRVDVPVRPNQTELETLINKIQALQVVPDTRARVVVNISTGSIAITENAALLPVAVTVGNLTISTTESPQVAQPNAFAQGDTAVVPRSNITVSEDQNTFRVLNARKNLRDLVEGLNSLGLTAREMAAVLESIKDTGALQAEMIYK